MRSLVQPLVETVLDPAVLVVAATASIALFSGLAARVFEAVQHRTPSRSTRRPIGPTL